MKKFIFICFIIISILGLSIFLLIKNADKEYTITFIVESEAFYTIQTRGFEEIDLPITPIKQNFTFDGWYFDENTWNNKLTATYYSSLKINSDVVVYAKFYQSSKIISFYVNDVIYYTFNFLEESNFELPDNPSLENYVFAGWYYDNNVWQEKATFEDIPQKVEYSNKNVYAKFISENECQVVNFYVNNELYFTDILNENFTMPDNPSINYYTFNGWFFDYDVWADEATINTIKRKTNNQINIYAKMSTEYASNLNYILSDDQTYYIVKGRGECSFNKILIPNFYNGLPVKEIASKAFCQDSTLEEVIIGSNVEQLGLQPFGLCSSLTRVDFLKNSKLHTLGRYSFNGCSLTYLFIPKGISQIPKGCFAGSITNNEIIFEAPENIIEIVDAAFQSSSFTSLPYFSNLEKIGESAFRNCGQLTSFYLPKSLKYIGDGAFNDCRKLKYVEMEDLRSWLDVEIVGGRFSMPWCYATCFYINNEKVIDIVIPEGVKEIKDFAFFDCNDIENITIPESVEVIGTAAFASVLKLKTLNYNAINCELSLQTTNDLHFPFERAGQYTITTMHPTWRPPEGYKDVVVNFGKNVINIPSKLFYTQNGYYPAIIGTINFNTILPPTIGENWITTTDVLKAINVPANSIDAYKEVLEEELHNYITAV